MKTGRGRVARVRVGERMTIYEALALKSRLLRALDTGIGVEVELSRVREIDTAGVQLLAMAKREAARRGTELRLVGHSKACLEALDLLNLAPFFGDPVLIPSAEPRAEKEAP